MITHDVKPTLKTHFGFNAFYTTPIKPKNTQNISVLSSVKPFMCIPAHSLAYLPQNYAKNPYFVLICYNNAITHFKGVLIKCI